MTDSERIEQFRGELERVSEAWSIIRYAIAERLERFSEAMAVISYEIGLIVTPALKQFVDAIDLHAAARARGRHRRKLIDQIARERGVRPSEIRRKVAAIRAQH